MSDGHTGPVNKKTSVRSSITITLPRLANAAFVFFLSRQMSFLQTVASADVVITSAYAFFSLLPFFFVLSFSIFLTLSFIVSFFYLPFCTSFFTFLFSSFFFFSPFSDASFHSFFCCLFIHASSFSPTLTFTSIISFTFLLFLFPTFSSIISFTFLLFLFPTFTSTSSFLLTSETFFLSLYTPPNRPFLHSFLLFPPAFISTQYFSFSFIFLSLYLYCLQRFLCSYFSSLFIIILHILRCFLKLFLYDSFVIASFSPFYLPNTTSIFPLCLFLGSHQKAPLGSNPMRIYEILRCILAARDKWPPRDCQQISASILRLTSCELHFSCQRIRTRTSLRVSSAPANRRNGNSLHKTMCVYVQSFVFLLSVVFSALPVRNQSIYVLEWFKL
ncbi:KIDINS220 [Acanthosepion pharaonis]|uniref:KIDINS220 n=1 Tax=Acanthosepion pharaonis TaxID=158019 RepID=A0A812CLX2_ACAPH|nr:KIDINS220 [Sepia pharaonis]